LVFFDERATAVLSDFKIERLVKYLFCRNRFIMNNFLDVKKQVRSSTFDLNIQAYFRYVPTHQYCQSLHIGITPVICQTSGLFETLKAIYCNMKK
jgi:hypothetical protein